MESEWQGYSRGGHKQIGIVMWLDTFIDPELRRKKGRLVLEVCFWFGTWKLKTAWKVNGYGAS